MRNGVLLLDYRDNSCTTYHLPRLPVVASEAKQSSFLRLEKKQKHGLLRRFAPRNDDSLPLPLRGALAQERVEAFAEVLAHIAL